MMNKTAGRAILQAVDSAPINQLARRGRRRKETVDGDFSG
jgi:hypothetical protein